jgi:NAD(P)H-dependent FMN reductase
MNNDRSLIQAILGSTRPGRFSEKAGAWVMDRLGSRTDLDLELLDVRDFPMPLYEHERAGLRAPLRRARGRSLGTAVEGGATPHSKPAPTMRRS